MKNNQQQLEPLRSLTIAAVKYDLCYFRVYGQEYANRPASVIGYLWAEDMEEAHKTANRVYGEDYHINRIEQVYFLNGEPVRGRKQKELTDKCLVKF